LKIELPAPLGTRYYSDRDLTIGSLTVVGKVAGWGEFSFSDAATRSTCTITFNDPDRSLLNDLSSVEWQGSNAVLYQYWQGLDETELLPIFTGILTGQLRWLENERQLQIELIDIGEKFNKEVGTIVSRGNCPKIDNSAEGSIIPIVYGKYVKRIRAVPVKVGRRGRLLAPVDENATTWYVEGFEDLSGEIWLRCGNEIVKGTINGTTLSNVERGAVLATGRVTEMTELQSFKSDLTNGFWGQWVGCWVRMNVPTIGSGLPMASMPNVRKGIGYSTSQARRITGYDPANGEITWAGGPFIRLQDGGVQTETVFGPYHIAIGVNYKAPKGKKFDIITKPEAHSAGDEVVEYLTDGVVYAVADHPVSEVLSVWVRGSLPKGVPVGELGLPDAEVILPLYNARGEFWQNLRQAMVQERALKGQTQQWFRLPATKYKVNKNDTTSVPGIGHAITTITLPSVPSLFHDIDCSSDEILVDVEGKEDGGTVLQNPVDVIRDLLTSNGVDTAYLDTSLTGTAVKNRILHLRFALAITERRRLLDIVSWLARSARCRLVITAEGKF